MSAEKTKKIVDQLATECIAVRIRKLNRLITNIYDDAFRPLEIKISQVNILVVTGKLGVARPAEVCELLQLSVSTLSRNVERMKSRGWIQSIADANDGRAQPFELGAEGHKVLARVMPAWRLAQQKAKTLLGEETTDILVRIGKTI